MRAFFVILFWLSMTSGLPCWADVTVDDIFSLPDGEYQVKIEGRPIFSMTFKTPKSETTLSLSPQLKMDGPKISHALYALYTSEIQDFFAEAQNDLAPDSGDNSLGWEIFHQHDYARALADVWFPEEVALGVLFKKKIETSIKQEINKFYIPKSGDEKKETSLVGEKVLLVTHSSRIFDKASKTKSGLDRIISHFKEEEWPVVFIMSDDQLYDFTWLSQDRSPTLAITSRNGEHHLKLATSKIFLAGGYFSLCLNRTLDQVIKSGKSKIKIFLPMDAIYEDVSFWPIDHLKGEAKVEAQKWKSSNLLTPTLYESFQNLGFKSILAGTRTLFSPLPRNYRLKIALDGRVIYSKGKGKKQIYLEFISPNKL